MALVVSTVKAYKFRFFILCTTLHRNFFLADDEDAGLRRISYIKATKEDRIQAGIDSDDFEDDIILGIEHDYDVNNSEDYTQHRQHKRYFSIIAMNSIFYFRRN